MSSSYLSFFDMAISGIPALLFCGWQYVSITREIARDKAAKDASPKDSGHPVGQHRQDDR